MPRHEASLLKEDTVVISNELFYIFGVDNKDAKENGDDKARECEKSTNKKNAILKYFDMNNMHIEELEEVIGKCEEEALKE